MITLPQTYRNGQRTHVLSDGVLTIYFEDGKVKAQGPYVDDRMEGDWIFYRKGGSLWQTASFLHDAKTGEWIRYDEAGNVVFRQHY